MKVCDDICSTAQTQIDVCMVLTHRKVERQRYPQRYSQFHSFGITFSFKLCKFVPRTKYREKCQANYTVIIQDIVGVDSQDELVSSTYYHLCVLRV